MTCVVGMDIGAISVKTILINGTGVMASSIFETGVSPKRTAVESLQAALEIAGMDYGKVSKIVTTGHGRNKVSFSNMKKSEVSCIAKGARMVAPEASVIIDVGGQGIRVIRVANDGAVEKFLNNDKCSAGTGCFLDSMAVALKVGIEDLGELSKRSVSPSCMSTKCTIFAESEVVSLVARGTSREDIIAGLHQSVAQKVQGLVKAVGGNGGLIFCGGVARNTGVVEEMKKTLGTDLRIPPHPQLLAALGAALFGLESIGSGAQ
ncbi:MAG: acyl-CoA dehydratase activase [Thermoplasmatota archaeon]